MKPIRTKADIETEIRQLEKRWDQCDDEGLYVEQKDVETRLKLCHGELAMLQPEQEV